MSPVFAAAVAGFALGWSVAWPPGPINAEIVRRGLTRGFASAFAVGFGASTGDFTWALAIGLGAGAVAHSAAVSGALSILSVVLLLGLAAQYFRGAVARWRSWRAGAPAEPPRRLDSARGGYALGLVMALTSPFNIAFWLAVIGRPEISSHGFDLVLVTAISVIAGTLTWVTALSASVVFLRARFDTPLWDIATHGLTGVLLAAFAGKALLGG